MEKRLIYPQYNREGHRDVFSITDDRKFLIKQAEEKKSNYHPAIQKYIANSKPIDNLIQVLMTALGAHEFWGQNTNGDRFYEKALKHEGTDYGFQTFLTNANYFIHHVNKDPALAKGKVLAAVWNDKAKRVELVLGINPILDPDAPRMLDNGESLCFSMGARLPFDVCTVCGNQAKTRAQYCDHLRYQMNTIDPQTGILVGADNPTPKFFDISRVLIPADKTAYMWEKIASAASPLSKLSSAQLAEIPAGKLADMKYLQEKVASNEQEKLSAVKKTGHIDKRIIAVSQPQAVEKLKKALTQVKMALDTQSKSIPVEILKSASLDQVITTMASLGMCPTQSERSSLYEIFAGKDGTVPPITGHASQLNLALLKALAPYADDRSFLRPIMLRRITILGPMPSVEKTAATGDILKGLAGSAASSGASLVGGAAKVVGSTAAGTALGGASLAKGVVRQGIAITEGVLTALGGIFGVNLTNYERSATSHMSPGFAGLIAKYPILAGLVGAMLLRKMMPPTQSKSVSSGNFTVANPTQGFYNNDWQRRFMDMQSRPVSVIKTGAAEQQSDLLVSPLTYLIMTADLEKTADQQRMWDISADQFLTDLSQKHAKIVTSAQQIESDLTKMASSIPEVGDYVLMKQLLNFY